MTAATAALALVAVVALAVNNLRYPGLLWDESAQFWVSQGLSISSPPFAERRGLREVVHMNRRENLDPGGFSVLLHLWAAHNRGIEHLRLLPFIFFALGAACLGLVGWRLTTSARFALVAAVIPLLYTAERHFAFEIRAYSMEMAGVAAGALALVYVLERPTVARAAWLGTVLACFLTSRYSFVLVVAATGGALWLGVVRRRNRSTAWRCLLAAWLPAIVAGAFIGWVTLRHQLRPEMKGGPLGIAAPAYTRGSSLGNGAADLALVSRNLLAPAAIPITVCALYAVLLRRRLYRRAAVRHLEGESQHAVFTALYAVVLGTQLLSAAASLAGMYPWDITRRWSAYLVGLSALAAVVLAAEAVTLRRFVPNRESAATRVIGRTVALVVVGVASWLAFAHRQSIESLHRTDLTPQLAALPVPSLPDHSVLVTFYEVPVVRYLYEFGPFAHRLEYPRAFRFETLPEWTGRVPLDEGVEEVRFVVTALTFDEARSRFPTSKLTPSGPPGSRLLAVVPSIDGGAGVHSH